jgi:phosphoribosyl 1,2-cyclic phosphodiesterase/ActR/RegA family two-component response regulator
MRTILLIDDDEMCRAPAAEYLRGKDWQVIEADDGEQGIELAVRHRPEVILCDLLMPRGNGYQVCRAVRAHFELRHTKIIVVTGRDYPSDRKSAQEAGADEYLVKPIEFQELEKALSRMLPPGGAAEASREAEDSHGLDGETGVRFWGVRGSIPSPGPGTAFFGGNTSCVEVRADGQLIILDAGSGLRVLGNALVAEYGETPIDATILISHTHWDHIQGFPFFAPAYDAKNRFRILGYEGAAAGLAATLAGQMESPYFPVSLKQMPGNIVIEELRGMEFSVGPIRVEACFSNHPGVCVGYRLYTSTGSVVYLPDNESVNEATFAVQGSDALPRTIEQKLAAFVKGADVLICDSQYTREEYAKHVGWGHGCVDDVVRFAIRGEVKRLYLFHFDPSHDDRFISGMLMHARALVQEAGSTLRVEAAREGDQITLAPRALAAV